MRALATLTLIALAAATPLRAKTIEEAKAEAAASGRLVLVDASSPSCAPCRRFIDAQRTNDKLRAGLARYAFVVVDDDTPEGQRTHSRLQVYGVPTFILLTAKGEEIDRWSGFTTADDLLHRLAVAAADPTTLDARRARFETAPTAALARRIADGLVARSRKADAIHYYDRAMELDPSLVTKLASDRFYAVSNAVYGGDLPFEALLAAGVGYAAAFPGATPQAHIVARNVATALVNSLPDDFDRVRVKPALERALATYKGKLSAEEAAQRDRLATARLPPRSLDQRLADLDAKPSVDATLNLLGDLQSAGRHADAARIARLMVDLAPGHEAQLAHFALSVVADAALEGQVSVADLEAAAMRASEAGGGTEDVRLETIGKVARALAAGQDADLLRAQVAAGLALTEGKKDESSASTRAELRALQAAVLEKDGAKALSFEKQSLGEGWETDPSQVLDLAEFLLDCRVELPEAERLGREALAATGSNRDARNRSSLALARALRAQGRGDEAVAVLEVAARASPHDAKLARALAAK